MITKNNKILIVENSEVTVNTLTHILEQYNFEVIGSAGNGKTAIDIARTSQPDLIIMDIDLHGEMDGIETAKNINSYADTPIIFLTANNEVQNIERIKEAGPYTYLSKRFKKSELYFTIETSFLKHKMTSKIRESDEARDEIEALLSSLVTILIGISDKDIITHWNHVAESTFGIKSSDIIGKNFKSCGLNWDWELIYEGIVMSISEMKPVKLNDLHFVDINNNDGFLDININPVTGKNGYLKGFLINGEDITKRKQLERQLSQAQKLESIGQLSSGIAHEINTPTQYITDNTYFLKDAFSNISEILRQDIDLNKLYENGEDTTILLNKIGKIISQSDLNYLIEEIPRAIDQSIEGLSRVTKIVKSMKQFAHPGTDSTIKVNINNLLDDIITISRNEWKYTSEVVTDFKEDLPLLPCFPGELNQAFLNIIINSSDAIKERSATGSGEKGIITISTDIEDRWIIICITDTGAGIPEDIQDRIFDPFFTTKDVGKGSGQGLSLVYDIVVNKHKGSIDIKSKKDKGATCTIKLPI